MKQDKTKHGGMSRGELDVAILREASLGDIRRHERQIRREKSITKITNAMITPNAIRVDGDLESD